MPTQKKEPQVTITLEREESGDVWLFNVERLDGSKKRVEVEFNAKERCTYKGYQILYPVDQACDEPSEYVTDVEIEEVRLVIFDEDGDEDDCEDHDLESDEEELITDYIIENYEF